jgi:hypothetical protein
LANIADFVIPMHAGPEKRLRQQNLTLRH